jgi:4-amino-4-deoxy-L-arabinose transferase-like glycosyltransferase
MTAGGSWIEKRYTILAVAILALALFNLTFRLNQEFVAEWDESLYAINAWEAVIRGSWLATTFLGDIDYYNSKPPLLVWLIALAFKALGPGFVSLRLVSVASAWLTVAVLLVWMKRCLGPAVALMSSLVLATMFGFIHVHAGRSAATDAPFTLIVLLTAVVLWAERGRPSHRLWLGPLLAAAFMLRGMAVLMPLALVFMMWLLDRETRRVAWQFTVGAMALCILPIAAWMLARYRVDGWLFFDHLFMYDFVARSSTALEGHPGSVFFYLDELQKSQFDWLLAGVIGFLLFPVSWSAVRSSVQGLRDRQQPMLLLVVWALVTLGIPSLMATKTPWYLNTFFPVFSVGVALSVLRAFESAQARASSSWRLRTLVVVLVVVAAAAESRLVWYSFRYRDLSLSEQSIVLKERERLRGHQVYLIPHSAATRFVADAMVGAEVPRASDYGSFLRDSRAGDYVLTTTPCDAAVTQQVTSNSRHYLCVRR